MKVYVIGSNGRGLMPTTPRKARILLRDKKAQCVRKVPFTIRLLYKTGSATQHVDFGIDTGSQHIGVAVVSENKVLTAEEYAMRTTMDKRRLLAQRKEYRRGRRYRKTPYRKPKFKSKTIRQYSAKPVRRNKNLTHWVKTSMDYSFGRDAGWLPPSIQSKVDMEIQIIAYHLQTLPDNTALRLEIGRFDVAKIKNPDIQGIQYQRGHMYDYENIRAYVFSRDGYQCKVCGRHGGSKRQDGSTVKLVAHHIDFRSQGATDNPDRMICVCDQCHTTQAHQPGGILYQWMQEGKTLKRYYRDETFMNILRKRLMTAFPEAEITYGHITSADRKSMKLPKSHANDAIAIATQGQCVDTSEQVIYYQQVRSRKRSLHEANPRKGRKSPNTDASRNRKNCKSVTINRNGHPIRFHVYDRVSMNGQTGWISGFTGTSAYVKDAYDQYIQPSGQTYHQVSLSKLKVISHNHNWLVGARRPIGQ